MCANQSLGRALDHAPSRSQGVWSMMSFLALHRIAAQRGEGLRPELASLMERENHSKDELGFQGQRLTTRALVEAIDRVAMAE